MIGVSRLGPIRSIVRSAVRDLNVADAKDAEGLATEAAAVGATSTLALWRYAAAMSADDPRPAAARQRQHARAMVGEVLAATVAAEAVDIGDNAEGALVSGLEGWATVTARYAKALLAAQAKGEIPDRDNDRLTGILSEAVNTAGSVLDSLGDDTTRPNRALPSGGAVWRLAQSVRLFRRQAAREAAMWRRARMVGLLTDDDARASPGAGRQARYRRLKAAGFAGQVTVPLMADDLKKLRAMGLLGEDPTRQEIQAAVYAALVEKLTEDQNRESNDA